jgi:hypothetical protein
MSILERAAKPAPEPIVCTIVGVQGTGKTSLACTFPAVFMIRTQGEKPPYDIPANQVPTTLEVATSEELWETLKALLRDDHSFETLVFDTASGLDAMFTQDVLAADPNARGLNQSHGGYGNGASMVSAMHMRVRKAAEMLRKQRGMNIVFLAHAEISEVTPPDGDPYSTWTLRLPKKSTAPYLDSVDCVGFLKQERVVRGAVEAKNDRAGKAGRAITTGDRVLVTHLNPAMASKNRYGITEDLEVIKGENPLASFLKPAAAPQRGKRKPAEPIEAVDHDEDAAIAEQEENAA